MGIYLNIGTNFKIPPHIRAKYKINLGKFILKYLIKNELFTLNNIKIWNNAPSEIMNGKEIKNYSLNDADVLDDIEEEFNIYNYYNKYYNSIIRINGSWTYEGGFIEGYISVNNNWDWRNVYYDIEIDCYSKDDINDITDYFFKLGNRDDVIENFIESISNYCNNNHINLNRFIYSHGVADINEFEKIKVIHTSSFNQLMDFFYDNLKNDEDSWIENKVKPYKKETFLKIIKEDNSIKNRFEEISQEHNLEVIPSGSVIYISNDDDSLINVYNVFKEEIFKKVAEGLPPADFLYEQIKNSLLGKKQLKL